MRPPDTHSRGEIPLLPNSAGIPKKNHSSLPNASHMSFERVRGSLWRSRDPLVLLAAVRRLLRPLVPTTASGPNEALPAERRSLATEAQLRRLNEDLEAKVEARTREVRETQAQLLRAQKMDAVGRLTGGVAHDFNNLLTIVLGNATALRMKAELRGDSQSIRRAELIERAAERGGRLAGQLLAFSRRQMLQPEDLLVDGLLRGMLELLLRAAGETIQVDLVSTGDLWHCHVDPSQLESAVLNLVLNARDAMPVGGGRITIRCENETVDTRQAHRSGGAPGSYVRIDVTDTGCGIPAELLEKVFDPFFTTKEVGKGSGLGLAQVHGFVGQSGGWVDIKSKVGRGTTVSLFLPRVVTADCIAIDTSDATPESGLGRSILVVEDEPDLRETVCAMLEGGGYRVLAAADAAHAREYLARDEPLHLLFTDVVLPGGVSGVELARSARATRQDLLVLLTSGYASTVLEAHGAESEFEVVAKPYQPDDLLRVLGAMLRNSLVPAETEALLAEVRDRPRPITSAAPSRAPDRGLGRIAGGRPRANTIRLGVMPFRAIDPHLAYDLSLGLAEEITTALSRFRWISCVASASLAAVADEPLGESPRWRKLDLDFLLDGTFQCDRGRVRIIARLLDMSDSGEVIWAQPFNRNLNDLLTLQEQIAAETVAQVGPEVLLRQGERAEERRPIDPSSYELMLRAIPAIYRLHEQGFRDAGGLLEEALRLDPDNAPAHAWLAHWHLFLVGQGWAEHPASSIRTASHLAARAVALDPADARCLAVAGHIRAFLHKQADQAIGLHERAISINPNLALAWCFSGLAHMYLGRHEEAIRRIHHARHLSPYDPHGFFFDHSLMMPLMFRGEYDAAAEIGRRSIEMNPAFSSAYKSYLATVGHLGRSEEAKAVRDKLLGLEPDFTVGQAIARAAFRRPEDLQRYADGLRLAGLPEGD